MYIKPTIGRILWYRPLKWDNLEGQPHQSPRDPSEGFMTAQVCSVEHPGSDRGGASPDYALVNLVVTDRYGTTNARRDITIRHDIDPGGPEACPPGCAVWMPYQQGQARAAESPQEDVASSQEPAGDQNDITPEDEPPSDENEPETEGQQGSGVPPSVA